MVGDEGSGSALGFAVGQRQFVGRQKAGGKVGRASLRRCGSVIVLLSYRAFRTEALTEGP